MYVLIHVYVFMYVYSAIITALSRVLHVEVQANHDLYNYNSVQLQLSSVFLVVEPSKIII